MRDENDPTAASDHASSPTLSAKRA